MCERAGSRACGISGRETLPNATLQARSDEVRPENLEIASFVLVTACHGIVHTTVVDRPELLENDDLAEETAELVLRYLQKDV